MWMECGEIQSARFQYWLGQGGNSQFFILVFEWGDTKKDVVQTSYGALFRKAVSSA
jgi:hypothetical protein